MTTDDTQDDKTDRGQDMDISRAEFFRLVANTDGPICIKSPLAFQSAVAALAGWLDGPPTGATIKVAEEGDDKFVWFSSDEADLVWGSWRHDPDIDGIIDDMPYPSESVQVSDLLTEALGWPEVEWL